MKDIPLIRECEANPGFPSPTATSNVETYGNVWVREVILGKKGDKKTGHFHKFDHLHFVSHGSVKVRIWNKQEELLTEITAVAPKWLKVPKELMHDIEALEDNTQGYCIQALYSDGNVVVTDFINDVEFAPTLKDN